MTRLDPDEDGLRETFLATLPSAITDQLRIFVRGLHGFVTRCGLSGSGSDRDREDALLAGLWKELDYLGRLSSSLEKKAKGARRLTFRRIRELLEDARETAAPEVPESLR